MKDLKRLTIILVLSFALGAISLAAEPLQSIGLYRWIEKGTRYSYVGNFPRDVMVESYVELDSVRVAIDAHTPSMIKSKAAAQFTSIFDSVKVDFREESLALKLLALSSGSFQVATGTPTFDGDTLRIPIEVIYPQIGTCDMAYYLYAIAVKKSVVRAVKLEVEAKRE